jgi:hypothetical protein
MIESCLSIPPFCSSIWVKGLSFSSPGVLVLDLVSFLVPSGLREAYNVVSKVVSWVDLEAIILEIKSVGVP